MDDRNPHQGPINRSMMTKTLRINDKKEERNQAKQGSHRSEDVSSFHCLESMIAMDRGTEKDVRGRLV